MGQRTNGGQVPPVADTFDAPNYALQSPEYTPDMGAQRLTDPVPQTGPQPTLREQRPTIQNPAFAMTPQDIRNAPRMAQTNRYVAGGPQQVLENRPQQQQQGGFDRMNFLRSLGY